MRQYRHPKEDEITITKLLAALSDPVRLMIVGALARGGERGWSGFDTCVANSTLSHHMKVLREAGVISNRGDGTRCFVSLRPELEHNFPGLIETILKFAGSDVTQQKPGAPPATAEETGKASSSQD
ncbi:transcriptional regulator, ArsR family [Rhizobiales bacterium GAS191]|jgi:DNA-binding transcriptional ArsR family regulator|nr:transcriptional regulator, ArsR family [Rhizobiales bacterium GAS188]SEE45794.1 transcriptional regulator, ArsR family [Rhizobiales bacterium GAS191]